MYCFFSLFGYIREKFHPLQQVQAQDLEPQPYGQGVRVRERVAPERRCSIEDPAVRHGRKS